MERSRLTHIKYFIGVDISKNKLDVCIIKDAEIISQDVIDNKPVAIRSFLKKLRGIPGFRGRQALFCMEHTGVYGHHLMQAVHKAKINIAVENAFHIKRSMGLVRGKTDKTDAHRIALYAVRNLDQIRYWQPPRMIILRLRNLFALRERLVTIGTMLKNPVKEQDRFLLKEYKKELLKISENTISVVESNIVRVEKLIDNVISSDEKLANLNRLITSVPGIGKQTALQLIIRTNEFRDYNHPKKFACYAGVAPFKTESGLQTSKARVSHIANKKMKSLLHICAVSAIRFNPELRGYYLRKVNEDKKSKMLVINAVRNKLLTRIYACVRENRPYIIIDTTGAEAIEEKLSGVG